MGKWDFIPASSRINAVRSLWVGMVRAVHEPLALHVAAQTTCFGGKIACIKMICLILASFWVDMGLI